MERRGTLALLLLLFTAAMGAGAGVRVWRDGPPLDFTPQALFMDAGPEFELMDRVDREFGREDNTVQLVLHGPIADEAGVAAVRALHDAAAAVPGVESVRSVATATVLEGGDGLLQVAVPADDLAPADALARVRRDPLLGPPLVSADLDTTAIQVVLDREAEKVSELEPRVGALMAAVSAVPLPDGVTLLPTGVPWVRVEVVDLMWRSQTTFLPIVAALFAVTMGLMVRRLWLGLAPLVTVLLADVWVLGALVAAGETLNVLSVLVPTLVVVIGVADGVHIVSRYREELGSTDDRAAAMARTMHHMVLPCFLTTFTTAAGFVSLLVADTAVIRAFGVQCAVAMVLTFFAIVSMLPVLLAFIPADRVRAPARAAGGRTTAALSAVHRLVVARPGATLGVTALLTAAAAAVGLQVQTNSGLLEMYREGMPTWHAIRLTEQELAGVIPVMVHVQGAPGQMLEPGMLTALDRIEAAVAAAEPVRWAVSPASVVRALHQTLTGEPGLPGSPDLISQEVLLAEISGDRSLEAVLSADRSQARVLALLTDAGGRVYVPLRASLQAAADAAVEGTGATARVTGDGFLAASGVDRLITDLLASLGLVFGIITLTFAVLLRDLKLALVAAVPNLVPLVFTLATLVAMGADLQTSNVVSFTVAVGLAVDDTIHYLVRYKQEREAGRRVDEALRRTTLGAGHAIIVTSVLLIAGFGVLATDDLTSTRHFGVLSSVTMAAALLGDLFLLPALLKLVERDAG